MLDAYKSSGNTAIPDEDVAMDFVYGCDNAQSVDFKAEIVNDIVKEVMAQPKDLIAIKQRNWEQQQHKYRE
jgi:hypothetical protein